MTHIRLFAAVLSAATLCALSGCAQPAGRNDLIRWFQENYTDAPVVVASKPVEAGQDRLYEAYLEACPEWTFYLRSDWRYVAEHSVYQNGTNFYAVYGGNYFLAYQREHPVQFARKREDGDVFSLEVSYADRSELAAAFDELQGIQDYLDAQEHAVEAEYHVYFASPLCPDSKQAFSLGSGTVTLRAGSSGEALARKRKDLECELAVWTAFFRLHTDWFTEEELAEALAYQESGEYGGNWHVYIGGLTVCSGAERLAVYPRTAAPEEGAVSFRQLYQILTDLNWESLEGNEDRFSFTGAGGAAYAFSYEPQAGTCTWLADGAPYEGYGVRDGYILPYTFQQMTGLEIKTEASPLPKADGEDSVKGTQEGFLSRSINPPKR